MGNTRSLDNGSNDVLIYESGTKSKEALLFMYGKGLQLPK